MTIAKHLFQIVEERRKLHAAREDEFLAALRSTSLADVSRYLNGRCGAFTVREYVTDTRVKKKVDSCLRRITDMVGTEEQLETAAKDSRPESVPEIALRSGSTSQFDDLREMVFAGRVWDAIARLRLSIEQSLASYATRNELRVRKTVGAGALLRDLETASSIPANVVAALRYAIHQANRAVHGENMTAEQALNIIAATEYALGQIEMPQSRPPPVAA